ncbi:MAG: FKBP-type peptidyl-prolyl cis-trans isomerase [Candidatus Sericytochromatia bacterium]|nr:FKBP-type peptidyl-prolyl cis-trans isomerase [Candidatus Sericytochromatia bacterium]
MKTRLYSFSLTALLSAYLLAGGGASCSLKQESHSEKPMSETQNATPNATQMKIEEIKVGTGATPAKGDTVIVHYTGWLTNGDKFDSSKDRNEPFSFTLGVGQVIKGWDEGFAGMKEGGQRKLTIPPEMGYGQRNVGPIPANSTLIFEVELIRVEKAK